MSVVLIVIFNLKLAGNELDFDSEFGLHLKNEGYWYIFALSLTIYITDAGLNALLFLS